MRIEKHRLPLNALRAFEAAGRHLHMRHAAEEMCVSHSAISQQVRKLESLLDVKLLERTNKGLQLTPPGSRLLHDLTAALDGLVRATAIVAPEDGAAGLRVACAAGIAGNWLLPHLDSFLRDYEAFSVQLDPISIYPKEIPTDVDLAITYGKPPVSDDRITQLPQSPLLPVCSPELVSEQDRGRSVLDQISRYTLLHADDGSEWQSWFQVAGAEGLFSEKNLYLSTGYHMILDSIRRRLGIGLIAKRFIENDIESGRLIVLDNTFIFEPEHYYVIRPTEPHRSQAGRSFEKWVYRQWHMSG